VIWLNNNELVYRKASLDNFKFIHFDNNATSMCAAKLPTFQVNTCDDLLHVNDISSYTLVVHKQRISVRLLKLSSNYLRRGGNDFLAVCVSECLTSTNIFKKSYEQIMMSEKVKQGIFVITLPNIDRLSKFFHCRTLRKIAINLNSHTWHLKRVATLPRKI